MRKVEELLPCKNCDPADGHCKIKSNVTSASHIMEISHRTS